jgi:hypothetical protein
MLLQVMIVSPFNFAGTVAGQGDLKMARGDSAAVPALQLEPVETVQRNVT